MLITLLMTQNEIEVMCSKWQRSADRERVGPRTAVGLLNGDRRQDTSNGPRSTISAVSSWTLLESMIYVARRPRIVAPARSTILRPVGLSLKHNLAQRRSPCNTLLRRVGLLRSGLLQPFYAPKAS